MKKITILGSTGSIGRSTLDVARHLGRERIAVTALAAHKNGELLSQQIEEFKPEAVALADAQGAAALRRRYPAVEVLDGADGVAALAQRPVDIVVGAITGTMGIVPVARALEAGNDVALANKEALVSAGALIRRLARQRGCLLLPIDSEQNAIFQCLMGHRSEEVRRLILTASGGPFRTYSEEMMRGLTAREALSHPTWNMGAKITIDSSTLMNKGLEVIEAHWFFDVPADKIDVFIHPQSVVHSMVEFIDNTTLAQLSHPDMRLPIQATLTYPERLPSLQEPLDVRRLSSLEFAAPDLQRFPCLQIAYDALKAGQSYCCYLNAVNEVLVERFLEGAIGWHDIAGGLRCLLDSHRPQAVDTLEEIMAVDALGRREASLLWATA